MLFWENEVLAKVVGVFEFYGRENAVRRQWEREEKEEKKENLEGKQRNSKNRTALDTQKEETMDWNTAFAVLRKFYEEKWDYLNGCPRNEKAWDEEVELQCKIYMGCNIDRINGILRIGTMCSLSFDFDMKTVNGVHHSSCTVIHVDSNRHLPWRYMIGQCRIYFRILQDTMFYHIFTAFECFFRRLEHKFDCAF